MFNVDGYRKKYREANIKSWYVKLFNFAAINIIFLAALGVSFSILPSPTTWEWLAIPIVFVFSNFVEYILHRYPMHHKFSWAKKIYKQHAGDHHLLFSHDQMMIGKVADITSMIKNWWFIFVFILFVAIPLSSIGLLVSKTFAILMFISVISYYWLFDVFHLLAHTWPWFSNKFAKHHTIHHNTRRMREYNFNVIFPIFDVIFKTNIKE